MKVTTKRVIAFVLTLAMVVTLLPISSVQAAAKKPVLSAKTAKVTVGKKVTLKVKNQPKSAKVTWTSNNKKVATVSKKGVVRGVKKGTAKVTCKVKTSKKTYQLTCKVNVVNKKAVTSQTVTTQEALTAALKNKKLTALTIQSDLDTKFEIPEGNYDQVNLVVNVPNGDVENHGVFKNIDVQAIKSDTWTEYARGNVIRVSAFAARIIVGDLASVSEVSFVQPQAVVRLEVTGTVANVKIDSNAKVDVSVTDGSVGNVTLNAPAELSVSGKAESIPVTVAESAEGAKVVATVPVAIEAKANVDVTVGEGAENSTIKVQESSKEVKVDVKNETKSEVKITDQKGQTTSVTAGATATMTVDTTGASTTSTQNPTTTTPSNDNNSNSGSSSGASSGGSSGGASGGSPVVRPSQPAQPVIKGEKEYITAKAKADAYGEYDDCFYVTADGWTDFVKSIEISGNETGTKYTKLTFSYEDSNGDEIRGLPVDKALADGYYWIEVKTETVNGYYGEGGFEVNVTSREHWSKPSVIANIEVIDPSVKKDSYNRIYFVEQKNWVNFINNQIRVTAPEGSTLRYWSRTDDDKPAVILTDEMKNVIPEVGNYRLQVRKGCDFAQGIMDTSFNIALMVTDQDTSKFTEDVEMNAKTQYVYDWSDDIYYVTRNEWAAFMDTFTVYNKTNRDLVYPVKSITDGNTNTVLSKDSAPEAGSYWVNVETEPAADGSWCATKGMRLYVTDQVMWKEVGAKTMEPTDAESYKKSGDIYVVSSSNWSKFVEGLKLEVTDPAAEYEFYRIEMPTDEYNELTVDKSQVPTTGMYRIECQVHTDPKTGIYGISQSIVIYVVSDENYENATNLTAEAPAFQKEPGYEGTTYFITTSQWSDFYKNLTVTDQNGKHYTIDKVIDGHTDRVIDETSKLRPTDRFLTIQVADHAGIPNQIHVFVTSSDQWKRSELSFSVTTGDAITYDANDEVYHVKKDHWEEFVNGLKVKESVLTDQDVDANDEMYYHMYLSSDESGETVQEAINSFKFETPEAGKYWLETQRTRLYYSGYRFEWKTLKIIVEE